MSQRTKPKAPFVPHPRYGAESVASGVTVPEAEILRGHWRYERDSIFPESVLIADASKQNYSVLPIKYYVDVRKQCRSCERRFIFFAREQKHWFETLKFYIDADCVLCPDCRRTSQTIRRRLKRYSELFRKPRRSIEELRLLVEDATYLLEREVLRDLDRLRQLKNEALKTIPEFPGTTRLQHAVERARTGRL
jgi:putative zinc ribbon protein